MTPALKIAFFGAPQVILGKESLNQHFSGKPLALFSYLVVTGRAHHRDLLADLLWSELANQQARNNLRYLLPDLRGLLNEYLLITPQTIGFNYNAPYELDVERLRLTLTTPTEQLRTAELQAVLDLYQGEFLAGFTVRHAPNFEAWVTHERIALHDLVVRGLHDLADRYWHTRQHSAGLATTQRLLALEPWHEAGHRLQMLFLVHSGQRAAAITQFHHLRKGLVGELGVEPMAETLALYDWLIAEETPYQAAERIELVIHAQNAAAAVAMGASAQHNLPAQLTPFIGRQAEIAALQAILLHPDHRLVTLAGEGGTGKTRLALAIAQAILDFRLEILDTELSTTQNPKSKIQNPKLPDGLWFVPLASLQPGDQLADQLATVIANAMRLSLQGNATPQTQLFAHLRQQQALLILDNFEHLLAGADFVLELLQAAPKLKVLVTSRHILNCQAEYVWRVEGLPVPPPGKADKLPAAQLVRYEAISLFTERASRLLQSFTLNATNQQDIVQICQFVQGLPLGVELAAAQIRHYTCGEIATALQQNYAILATTQRDLAPRHRNIQATLSYSWSFLSADEARILALCSVFRGGFEQAAAEAVAGANAASLIALEDHSLLRRRQDAAKANRYELHELVRQHAANELARSAELQQAGLARHAAYFMNLLHDQETALLISADAQQTIHRELDNVRAAWQWSVEQGNVHLLTKAHSSLHSFYRLAGLYREAIQLLETTLTALRQILAVAPSDLQTLPLLARLLCHLAEFYRRTNGLERGECLGQEALVLGERLADPALQAMAYHELARSAQARHNFGAAREFAEAGYQQARQASSAQLLAECLNDLGRAVEAATDPLQALPYYYQALATLHGTTHRVLEAFVLNNLGYCSFVTCQYQAAYTYVRQGLALQNQLQDRGGKLSPLIYAVDLRLALGLYQEAQAEYAEAFTLVQMLGGHSWESRLYTSYGRWHHLNGDPRAARTAYTQAQQIAQQRGSQLQEQWALVYLGHALADLGEIEVASHTYQQAIALHRAGEWRYHTAEAYAGFAEILLAQNQVAAAVIQVEAALDLLARHGLCAALEPFTVYWTCVRVLTAAGAPRATEILRTAYQTLQRIADELEYPALRRSFLENVAVNRQLIAAAQAAGIA